MDPNLFFVDWPRTFEVLAAIVVLAFFIERALSILFESSFFIKRFQGKSFKELIAFIVSALVCWFWKIDALSIIFVQEDVTIPGVILTGAIIAGGSKASIKLFTDLLDFRSKAAKKKTLNS